MMVHQENLVIVLLGKIGCGKSSTGNSIAGTEVFEEKTSTLITKYVSEREGRKYTLYDTRGFFDPDICSSEEIVRTIKHTQKLMKESSIVHIFLLVFHFGIFSAEDCEMVERLKLIFGSSFLKEHCFIVMTHGDCFDEKKPFEDFCNQKTGKFHDLYKECSERIFLITNKGGYGENAPRVNCGNILLGKLQTWMVKKDPDRYCYEKDFMSDMAKIKTREMLAFDKNINYFRDNIIKEFKILSDEVAILQQQKITPSIEIKGRLYWLLNEIKENKKNLYLLPNDFTENNRMIPGSIIRDCFSHLEIKVADLIKKINPSKQSRCSIQ